MRRSGNPILIWDTHKLGPILIYGCPKLGPEVVKGDGIEFRPHGAIRK